MVYVFFMLGMIGWYNLSPKTFKGFLRLLVLFLIMRVIGFSANQIALIWIILLAGIGLYILAYKS